MENLKSRPGSNVGPWVLAVGGTAHLLGVVGKRLQLGKLKKKDCFQC